MRTIGCEELLGLISRSTESGTGIACIVDPFKDVYVLPRASMKLGFLAPFPVSLSSLTVDGETTGGKGEILLLADAMKHATLREGQEILRLSPEVSIAELSIGECSWDLKRGEYGAVIEPTTLVLHVKFACAKKSFDMDVPASEVDAEKTETVFSEEPVPYEEWRPLHQPRFEVVVTGRKETAFQWRGRRFSVSYELFSRFCEDRVFLPSLDSEIVRRVELQDWKEPFLYRLDRHGFASAARVSYRVVTQREWQEPGDWNDSFRRGHYENVSFATDEKWGEFVPVSEAEVRESIPAHLFSEYFPKEYLEAFSFSSEHEKWRSPHAFNKEAYRKLREKVSEAKTRVAQSPFALL